MKREIQVTPARKIRVEIAGRTIRMRHAKTIVMDPEAAAELEQVLTQAVEATEDLEGEPGNHERRVRVSRAPGKKVRLTAPSGDYTLTPEYADVLQADICELLEDMVGYSPNFN